MNKSTERPKKQPIKSDKQLKTAEAMHNLYIGIVVKWFVAVLFMIVLLTIAVLVAGYVIRNQEYIKIIADQFFANMGSIIVAVAVFLGLKTFPSNRDL